MKPITSSAQLRAALGIADPAPPRPVSPMLHPHHTRQDAEARAKFGFVKSSAEVRERLGLPKPREPYRPPEPKPAPRPEANMRFDAAPCAGPVRSNAELRRRLGMPA